MTERYRDHRVDSRHAAYRTRRGWARQAGQAMVLVGLLMPVLMAALGLSVDMALGFASRRMAQNAADAGAYGGALIVGDNSSQFVLSDTDVINAFQDALAHSSAPQTMHLYDPSSQSASNTLGTVDVYAQYVNNGGSVMQTGSGSWYIAKTSNTVPSSAAGVRFSVSWPQSTYFGKAVGWQQYNVAASATYVVKPFYGGNLAVAPFAVWWDPPYGASTTPQYSDPAKGGVLVTAGQYIADTVSSTTLCGTAVTTLPCTVGNSNNLTAPQVSPPVGTIVNFFSNGYQANSGAALDPDYSFGSNNFKGDLLNSGGVVNVCLGQPYNNGNGNHGSNSLQVLQNASSMVSGSWGTLGSMAVAVFPLVYAAQHSGSVYVYTSGAVPIIFDSGLVVAQGNSGLWSGTVLDWTDPRMLQAQGSCTQQYQTNILIPHLAQ